MRHMLCLFVLTSLLFCGCGVKAPPFPPQQIPPPAVTDLKSDIQGDIISLDWTILPAEKKTPAVRGFRVYRSKTLRSKPACLTCPVTFEQVADLPVMAENTASGKMNWSERLEKGFRYVYKVTGYSENGVSAKDSNAVGTDY